MRYVCSLVGAQAPVRNCTIVSILWAGLLVTFALTAFGFFVYALNRLPLIGFMCAAVTVLIAWEVPQLPQLFNVGGSSIQIVDIFALAFLAVGVARIGQLVANLGIAGWAWLALGTLLGISLIRGIPEFGIGGAVNEFRLFFHTWAALTWMMSLRRGEEVTASQMGRFALLLGWGLVLVASIHTAQHGLGSASELIDSGSGFIQTTRPLVSGQALMLLMCAAVCLWLWRSSNRRSYAIHAGLFALVVLVVQQRTVWSVGLMAILVVFLFSRARTKLTIVGALSIAAGIAPFLLALSEVQSLLVLLESSAENSSTYDARTVSWLNLIAQSTEQGQDTVLFGAPMGSGFGRFEGLDRWVTFAPHNWYLTIYLRAGVLGLVLFMLFVLLILSRALKRRADMASIAVIVMMLGYAWSYSWLWYSAIFAGWSYLRPWSNDMQRFERATVVAGSRGASSRGPRYPGERRAPSTSQVAPRDATGI